MRIPIYQIDAFASKVFRGNPAAVCPLESWLDDATMQAIAAENNLAETAFFVRNTDGSYDLRWFTPQLEVPLCGHATLASAFVLFEVLQYGEQSGDTIRFQSKSGELRVTRRSEGTTNNNKPMFVLDFPVRPFHAAAPLEEIERGLGARPKELYRTERSDMNYLAVFETPREVIELKPDFNALKNYGIIATSAVSNTLSTDVAKQLQCGVVDFISRYFAPYAGINEDPVTGSAHCTLVPYWAGKLGKTIFRAHQASARGGDLSCELRGDRVLMGGYAVPYLQGFIEV